MKDTLKEVAHFNKTSREYLNAYEESTAEGYSFRVRREKVLDLLMHELEGKSVLDIGSGPGIMTGALLKHNAHVTALDASEEMITRVKEQYGTNENVTFVVSDARTLPSKDNSFDIVIAMGLVEYFKEDTSFYREIKRVLKPSGILIVTYPNYYAPWRIWNRVILLFLRPIRKLFGIDTSKKESNIRHKEYTSSSVLKELSMQGFNAEETVYMNLKLIPYPFDVWFPSLTITTSTLFEKLDKSLFRWIGTGFIIKSRKMD